MLDYDDWLKQDHRHPHDAAHQGMHVFKPEPLLAVIDPGITPYAGSTIWLQAHRQSELRFRPAQDATGLQRFGTLSAAWVLQVLVPLLVIILGFNMFAGERELGTLRQTLSLGVRPSTLLWGKAGALGLAVAVISLPVLLMAVVAILSSPVGTARGDVLVRLVLLALGYAVYFALSIFVVLGVSAFARSSRIALTVLLGLWIVVVTLARRGVSDLAREWYPAPTRYQFNNALDAGLDTEYKRVWQERFGTDKRWGSDLPLSQWGLALKVDDHAGYQVSDDHFGKLWDA